ncbi:MAG: ECF transporter S component [Clostridia bacterium]|nr:ECF transporter S component [Clostridia bacterium]
MNTKILVRPKLSVKLQVLATFIAVAAAVALPQACHLIGHATGTGTGLGEMLLPMHLPVLLVGLLAGPYAGAAAGALSPLVSFALTAMPGAAMLPFMVIELCAYGLIIGLVHGAKMPTLAKVLIAQVGGRAVRAVALLIAVYALGISNVGVATIWMSIPAGILGIAIQLVILPAVMAFVQRKGE